MKLEFSGQIFEKYSDRKLSVYPFNGSRVFPSWRADWRTDRHVEANSRFSQFC